MISSSSPRIDAQEKLVEWIDDNILSVETTEKLKKLLLSLEGVLEQLEREKGSASHGVRVRPGGIREVVTSLVQERKELRCRYTQSVELW